MTTEHPDYSKSRSLLVGVSNFTDPALRPVPAALSNLAGMDAILTDSELCGWPADRVEPLPNPTRQQFAEQLSEIASQVEEVFILYYVGHGKLTPGGELYLTASDTRNNALEGTGLSYNTVREILRNRCDARVKIVVLDCCFSGQAIPNLTGSDVMADHTRIEGSYVLTATDANNLARVPSLEHQGKSYTFFTGALLSLIRAGLPKAPKWLTFEQIFPELKQRMRARNLPLPDQWGSSTAAHFPFSRNAAPPIREHASFIPERSELDLSGKFGTSGIDRHFDAHRDSVGSQREFRDNELLVRDALSRSDDDLIELISDLHLANQSETARLVLDAAGQRLPSHQVFQIVRKLDAANRRFDAGRLLDTAGQRRAAGEVVTLLAVLSKREGLNAWMRKRVHAAAVSRSPAKLVELLELLAQGERKEDLEKIVNLAGEKLSEQELVTLARELSRMGKEIDLRWLWQGIWPHREVETVVNLISRFHQVNLGRCAELLLNEAAGQYRTNRSESLPKLVIALYRKSCNLDAYRILGAIRKDPTDVLGNLILQNFISHLVELFPLDELVVFLGNGDGQNLENIVALLGAVLLAEEFVTVVQAVVKSSPRMMHKIDIRWLWEYICSKRLVSRLHTSSGEYIAAHLIIADIITRLHQVNLGSYAESLLDDVAHSSFRELTVNLVFALRERSCEVSAYRFLNTVIQKELNRSSLVSHLASLRRPDKQLIELLWFLHGHGGELAMNKFLNLIGEKCPERDFGNMIDALSQTEINLLEIWRGVWQGCSESRVCAVADNICRTGHASYAESLLDDAAQNSDQAEWLAELVIHLDEGPSIYLPEMFRIYRARPAYARRVIDVVMKRGSVRKNFLAHLRTKGRAQLARAAYMRKLFHH